MSAFKLSLKAWSLGGRLDKSGRPPAETLGVLAALARGAVIAGAAWAGLALVAAGLLLWRQDTGNLPLVNASGLLILLIPAGASYLLRLLRWYVLLRRAIGPVPALASVRAQVIGFALAVTPGRVAEPLKFYLLERSHPVTVACGGSVLIFERLSDALGLALIALLGLLLVVPERFAVDLPVHHLAVPLAAVALVVAAAVYGSRLVRTSVGRGGRWRAVLADFLAANRALLDGATTPLAVATTVLARMCDALVVFMVAGSVGLALSYPEAALVLGLAGLAGGFSLLPGGVGAVEAVMIGLFVGLGAPPPAALGVTIVVRVFSYWLWVAVGLAMLAVSWRGLKIGEKNACMFGLHPS